MVRCTSTAIAATAWASSGSGRLAAEPALQPLGVAADQGDGGAQLVGHPIHEAALLLPGAGQPLLQGVEGRGDRPQLERLLLHRQGAQGSGGKLGLLEAPAEPLDGVIQPPPQDRPQQGTGEQGGEAGGHDQQLLGETFGIDGLGHVLPHQQPPLGAGGTGIAQHALHEAPIPLPGHPRRGGGGGDGEGAQGHRRPAEGTIGSLEARQSGAGIAGEGCEHTASRAGRGPAAAGSG